MSASLRGDEAGDDGRSKKRQPPDPIYIPADEKGQLRVALDLVAKCRVSAGMRAASARVLRMACDTGREDGDRSLVNLLPRHINRLGSLLFDPVDLRFSFRFKRLQNKINLARAMEGARVVTDDWKNSDTDTLFGDGVIEALRYGCCILKQWPEIQGDDKEVLHRNELVMPWQFGVFREDLTDLYRQPAMCQTIALSLPEIWRRIATLPNARELYRRIATHARNGMAGDMVETMYHNVLSSSTLSTNQISMMQPMPGGIVQVANDSQYGILGAQVDVPLVRMHEVWAWDEKDYVTLQVIEPDILLEPSVRRQNLLAPNSGLQPFSVIRPNFKAQYFWGYSELEYLMETQGWASTTAADLRRCLGVQFDKILYFTGDQPDDEGYAAMRNNGFGGGAAGSKVEDLTPKFPAEAIPMFEMILRMFDVVGGFDNILSGRGESGVRAGVHANTLLRTASPDVRRRSLRVERQCADAGDLWFRVLRAKDEEVLWTDPEKPDETQFTMADIPESARAQIDSHSASPVFQGEFDNALTFLVKEGAVDSESAVEILPLPHKDVILERLRARELLKQKMIALMLKQDPESIVELVTGKPPKGAKRRA